MILAKFKFWLWFLGLYPNKCPYCGAQLVEHYNYRYTCPTEGCRFN